MLEVIKWSPSACQNLAPRRYFEIVTDESHRACAAVFPLCFPIFFFVNMPLVSLSRGGSNMCIQDVTKRFCKSILLLQLFLVWAQTIQEVMNSSFPAIITKKSTKSKYSFLDLWGQKDSLNIKSYRPEHVRILYMFFRIWIRLALSSWR